MHAQRLYQYAVTLYITDPRVLMHHRQAFEFQAVNVLGVDTLDAIIPPPNSFFTVMTQKNTYVLYFCSLFFCAKSGPDNQLCQVRRLTVRRPQHISVELASHMLRHGRYAAFYHRTTSATHLAKKAAKYISSPEFTNSWQTFKFYSGSHSCKCIFASRVISSVGVRLWYAPYPSEYSSNHCTDSQLVTTVIKYLQYRLFSFLVMGEYNSTEARAHTYSILSNFNDTYTDRQNTQYQLETLNKTCKCKEKKKSQYKISHLDNCA